MAKVDNEKNRLRQLHILLMKITRKRDQRMEKKMINHGMKETQVKKIQVFRIKGSCVMIKTNDSRPHLKDCNEIRTAWI